MEALDMKTNQIMIRQMGQFQVQQRTKDGMFNATHLLKQWNNKAEIKKDLDDYLSNVNVSNFVSILKRSGIDSPVKKSRARVDRGGGTWICSNLMANFICWLSPYFSQFVKMDLNGVSSMMDLQNENSQRVEKKTYLMLDSNTSLTKIGRSKNPRVREMTLQSEKPHISLFAICHKDVEKKLHSLYDSQRVRGEWFDLSKTEVEHIIKEYGFKMV